jgi:DNA polymerase
MRDYREEIRGIVSSLHGHLIYQRDLLLAEGVPMEKAVGSQRSVVHPHPVPSPSEGEGGGWSHVSRLTSHGSGKAELLQKLREEIGDCQRCKLGKTRTNLVFGVGNPNARIVFVGEGPGRDEDIKGEPFVGRAGQLLTDIITKGMKMGREDVYICNVVKCRPPENRNPAPDEIAACEPFLMRQLEIIRPEMIVALGTFAAQTLLKTDLPISQLRGRFHDYHGIKVMPTYHPAYLLRNPDKKRETWEDIKMVMAELSREQSR